MQKKKLVVIFFILFYLEMIYHFFVFQTINVSSLIYISICTLVTSLFIDLITNLFNHKTNKILFINFGILISIIFCVQFINYLFYGNVLSIYSIFNGGQVFEFFGQIFTVIKNNIIPILLFLFPIFLLIFFKKRIVALNLNKKELSLKLIFLIIMYFASILVINLDNKSIYSANNVYFKKHVPNQTSQLLGLITTMRLDISRTITGFEEVALVNTENQYYEKEKEYNQLNINFDNLIENESNSTINNIHQFIKSSSISEKNEYTGLFEGMNLIAITAEAFSPIAVDPILTPTLYKLVNQGFKFNNFYTPVYYVSTSDGEYVTLTSLLPKESIWSMSKSSNNYLPYTYGNVFSKLGYVTNAYHNGHYKYYGRDKSHPNMGYTYTGCGNGLQSKMNCKRWPQSDIEMIEATFDDYGDDEKFMTYYMTISGHLEYNFSGNNMAYKNKDLVQDLPYSNAIKAYIATQIELDRALELLINKLEEKGILDNTVIVLSSDHYPYGLKTSEMKEIMDIENEKLDSHKNELVIWNNKMTETIEINKYAQSLDIVPTVLNLFGIDFDSRLLMGRDILSNSDGLIIFNDRSWITKYGTYIATTKNFIPKMESIPENYVDNINDLVDSKFVISKNILENNYYNYLIGSDGFGS